MEKRLGILTELLLGLSLLWGCNTPVPPLIPQSPTAVPASPQPTQPVLEEAEVPPTPDLPVIAYNDIKEGQLVEAGASEAWRIEAQAGERLNLVVNGQFDSYLELYGPDHELIASNDDNGGSLNAALFDVQITQAGPHTILVRGFGQATGNYALALTGGHPTASGGSLNSGDIRAVILSAKGTKWHYTGQQGTYLTITTAGATGIDPYLSLYGPDGRLLISDDDSGVDLNAELYEFQLPSDGLYTLQARTISETGPVTLTLTSSAKLAGGGVIKPGQVQRGNLTLGRPHHWTFTGQVGQAISIGLASTAFDTFLELRDSQDGILIENDDFADSTDSLIDRFILPIDDTYTIVVRGLGEDDSGAYDLSLEAIEIPTGGGPLTTDAPIEAALLPGYVDNWFFEAEAGSFITITSTSTQLDTYLELYDQAGNLLLEDDDSGGDLNAALIEVPVESSGEYQVVVRSAKDGENEGGVYEVSLMVSEATTAPNQLQSGDLQTVTLEPGEQHTWTFTASRGNFVSIQMASDTLDTHLSLYNSDDTLLTLNDDYIGVQAAIVNYEILEDDEFRVVARTYSANESGEYTISLQISRDAGSLQSDQ